MTITMPSHLPPSPRHISCRLDGDVVVLDLGGDGRSEMLFLTMAEARALAEDLELELVGAVDDEMIVADVRLTNEDAWQLVDAIRSVLGDASAVWDVQIFDWRIVGF